MDVVKLQARVYYLMGKLDEAKKVANDAQGEIDAKKQTDKKSIGEVTSSNNRVLKGQ